MTKRFDASAPDNASPRSFQSTLTPAGLRMRADSLFISRAASADHGPLKSITTVSRDVLVGIATPVATTIAARTVETTTERICTSWYKERQGSVRFYYMRAADKNGGRPEYSLGSPVGRG